MLIAERKSRLRELLAERGISDLDSLASELAVSPSTVRRDIQTFEDQGLVKRTHGGVIWLADRDNAGAGGRPYAFDQRMAYEVEAKRQIARAAKSLVQPGETILIDGGTTTFYLAQELIGTRLQIVTNSLPIANLFLNDENIELLLTGGLLYPRSGVLLGPTVENFMSTIHARTMFLSVAGIHDRALYNQNLLLVQAEQRMMKQVQQVVLLADAEKFAQQALSRLCGLDEIDIVVTDHRLSSDARKMVTDAGCQLILADA
jgi:DeoR/GlpR family transcriptional regulator of sugar metabolism